MAIYSLNINITSRGSGKSAVAAAAYRAGECIKNDYDGVVHDFTKKKGVVLTEIMLPDHAPERYYNRSELWNAVEQSERAKNAQLCREVRLALPNEFDLEQNAYLVHEYVRENFVSRGMCADIAIHDNGVNAAERNIHAHILLTMRPIEQDGTWGAKSRMEYILDDNGERQKLPSGRHKTRKINTTDWDNRDNAEVWRKNWADILNKHLEHFSHETRVDHRSYERQGLEVLPTIHLGMIAHQLEEKGIATERGDINREIKKANAQLRELNKEIRKNKKERHDILNPPTPKFIIDIQNSIKAQNSVGYEKWATLFNLQQMAKTLIYVQENGYADWKSLTSAYSTAVNDYNTIINNRTEIKGKIKDLKALRSAATEYRNTRKVYDEWNAPGWIPHFKKQHYEKHKNAIEAHKKAKAYIYDELKLTKFPNLKDLSAEIAALIETEKGLTDSIPEAREKYKTLNVINHNTRLLLGYRSLEQKNIDPVTEIQHHDNTQGYANVPIFRESFISATNTGETAQYFQSQYLNRECAEAIYSAVDLKMATNRTEMEVATRIIETYGIERVKWVLAIVITNDTSEVFDKYRDWAGKIELPNEPIDKSVFEIGDFTRTFYPSFVRAVQIKGAEILWDSGQKKKLSHDDVMAVAKLKADEHNRNARLTSQYQTPTAPIAKLIQQTPVATVPIVETLPSKPKKKNRDAR